MPHRVTSRKEMKKTTKNFKGAFQSMGSLINEMNNSELMDSDSDCEQNDAFNKMWATPVRRRRIPNARKQSLDQESESESEDELSLSYPPPRRATPMTEVERLEKMRELLEDSIEDKKRRMKKPGTAKGMKASFLFQIANMETKLDNLLKRIVLEGKRGEFKAKTLAPLTRGRSSLGFNSHVVIEKRKVETRQAMERMREVLGTKEKEEKKKDEETIPTLPEPKNLGKWGKWEKVSESSVPKNVKSEKDTSKVSPATEKRLIRGPPSATQKFFPPIPASGAKKRPRDAIPLYFRRPEDVPGRRRKQPEDPKKRVILVPNKKRVANKRALVYIKQLSFAEAHRIDTKSTIGNLNDAMQTYGKDSLPEFIQPPAISRQKLYLMGALSRRHLYPPTERPHLGEDVSDEEEIFL